MLSDQQNKWVNKRKENKIYLKAFIYPNRISSQSLFTLNDLQNYYCKYVPVTKISSVIIIVELFLAKTFALLPKVSYQGIWSNLNTLKP